MTDQTHQMDPARDGTRIVGETEQQRRADEDTWTIDTARPVRRRHTVRTRLKLTLGSNTDIGGAEAMITRVLLADDPRPLADTEIGQRFEHPSVGVLSRLRTGG